MQSTYGKVSIGVVEEECQIGACEYDCLNPIPPTQCIRKRPVPLLRTFTLNRIFLLKHELSRKLKGTGIDGGRRNGACSRAIDILVWQPIVVGVRQVEGTHGV